MLYLWEQLSVNHTQEPIYQPQYIHTPHISFHSKAQPPPSHLTQLTTFSYRTSLRIFNRITQTRFIKGKQLLFSQVTVTLKMCREHWNYYGQVEPAISLFSEFLKLLLQQCQENMNVKVFATSKMHSISVLFPKRLSTLQNFHLYRIKLSEKAHFQVLPFRAMLVKVTETVWENANVISFRHREPSNQTNTDLTIASHFPCQLNRSKDNRKLSIIFQLRGTILLVWTEQDHGTQSFNFFPLNINVQNMHVIADTILSAPIFFEIYPCSCDSSSPWIPLSHARDR